MHTHACTHECSTHIRFPRDRACNARKNTKCKSTYYFIRAERVLALPLTFPLPARLFRHYSHVVRYARILSSVRAMIITSHCLRLSFPARPLPHILIRHSVHRAKLRTSPPPYIYASLIDVYFIIIALVYGTIYFSRQIIATRIFWPRMNFVFCRFSAFSHDTNATNSPSLPLRPTRHSYCPFPYLHIIRSSTRTSEQMT